jgi:hypothetical protein
MFIIKWFLQFFSKNTTDTHKVTVKAHCSDSELAEDLPLTLTKQSSPQAELN